MAMSIEAIVAIITLVVAVPPTAFIMWRWFQRSGNRHKAFLRPHQQEPEIRHDNAISSGQYSVIRWTTQQFVEENINLKSVGGVDRQLEVAARLE